MATVKEVIERLKWNGEQHIAVAIWSEDDILGRASERDIKISREEAREIIDLIDNKQDCSIGITWDTIDCYLDERRNNGI